MRISMHYPDEVIELAKTLPYSTDQVMGVYIDHKRDIKMTEKVLKYHMLTGGYVSPDSVDILMFKE